MDTLAFLLIQATLEALCLRVHHAVSARQGLRVIHNFFQPRWESGFEHAVDLRRKFWHLIESVSCLLII